MSRHISPEDAALLRVVESICPPTADDIDDPDKVLIRLCRLATAVNASQFKWDAATDCFCSQQIVAGQSYRFSELVLAFIERAVQDALKKKRKRRKK